MNKIASKIASGLIVIFLVGLLLIAGPANAFVLDLNIEKEVVNVGDIAKFIVSANIESGEIIPIEKFVFNINGPINNTCEFDPKTNVILGCDDIRIRQKSSASEHLGYGYGYGYGFEEGVLSYELLLNTSSYKTGEYKINLGVMFNGTLLKTTSGNLFIGFDPEAIAGCSVRADNGEIEIIAGEEFDSPRTKFSMKIPLGNAIDGKGYLTAQAGRIRINYDFKRIMILHNDENFVSVLVTGELRKGAKDKSNERAVVYLYKKEKRIDISGETFNIQHMDINFMRKCK